MQKFLSLILALEFIEQNLSKPISLEDVAKSAFISLSHLHRLFARVFRCSLKDYITKRRLCCAAYELVHTKRPITQLAFDYQYGNVESFSRAFKKQFLTSPSAFRNKNWFSELYPKIVLQPDQRIGDDTMTVLKRYDETEISKRIISAKGTYILDVDIDNLLPINEQIGRGAGDMAIAETAVGIESSLPQDTTFFRMGGDEFIVITEQKDIEVVEKMAQQILSYADNLLTWNGQTFTFSASVGIARIPDDIKDFELAINLAQNAMYEAKRNQCSSYKVV